MLAQSSGVHCSSNVDADVYELDLESCVLRVVHAAAGILALALKIMSTFVHARTGWPTLLHE